MKMNEKAFLSSTFREFNKRWRSGTKARVIMETFNGRAFVNFSAFLGHPDDVHFQPRPTEQNRQNKPQKKSAKKVKRDNERAAQFQEKKRKEKEAALTSKSTSAEFEYSFASPAREDLSNLSTSPTNDSTIQVEKLRTNSEDIESMTDVQSISSSTQNSEEEDPNFNLSAREEEDLINVSTDDKKEVQKSTKMLGFLPRAPEKLYKDGSFWGSSNKKEEKKKQNPRQQHLGHMTQHIQQMTTPNSQRTVNDLLKAIERQKDALQQQSLRDRQHHLHSRGHPPRAVPQQGQDP